MQLLHKTEEVEHQLLSEPLVFGLTFDSLSSDAIFKLDSGDKELLHQLYLYLKTELEVAQTQPPATLTTE